MHRRLAVLLFLILVSPAYGRSLRWEELRVDARLDADGVMHLSERHDMVFNGDWSGGERRFNIRPGQTLEVLGVSRVGQGEIPLRRGDLSMMDHWDFAGPTTIRWRARPAGDPPFFEAELIYVIDYTIAGVLTTSGGGSYDLHHDFAFADRPGVIERFALHFVLDPAWRGADSPLDVQRERIPEGQSFVVSQHLTYGGSGHPGARWMAPRYAAPALWIGIIVVLFLMSTALVRRERAHWRFSSDPDGPFDRGWFERSVLPIKPELLSRLRHGKTDAVAVAATLARMAQEKKISAAPEGGALKMRLLVPFSSLRGYESALVSALFVGREETDTTFIRQYYKDKGFDPSSLLKTPLSEELAGSKLWPPDSPRGLTGTAVFLILGSMAGMAAMIFLSPEHQLLIAAAGGIVFVFSLLGASMSYLGPEQIDRPRVWSLVPMWIVTLIMLAFTLRLFDLFSEVAAVAALTFACFFAVIQGARSSMSREKIEFLRRLDAARRALITELDGPDPPLRDGWLPWLVALDLGSNVEKWFSSFAGHQQPRLDQEADRLDPSRAGAAVFASNSAAGPASSPQSEWSGGGGAFGGAGATGSWVAAASTLSAGVAAPISTSSFASSHDSSSHDSSSSSGGSSFSSGSSSGSSGGGGGGGW